MKHISLHHRHRDAWYSDEHDGPLYIKIALKLWTITLGEISIECHVCISWSIIWQMVVCSFDNKLQSMFFTLMRSESTKGGKRFFSVYEIFPPLCCILTTMRTNSVKAQHKWIGAPFERNIIKLTYCWITGPTVRRRSGWQVQLDCRKFNCQVKALTITHVTSPVLVQTKRKCTYFT